MENFYSSLGHNPLKLTILLMMIVAPIGAIDMIYYHIWKFKLFRQPTSRKEMITHLIRGLLFAAGAFVLFNYEPNGGWYWIIGALFLFDFINSIADASLEKESRAPLGGLPTLEYVIHNIGSTFAGAITISYFILGWNFHNAPTALVPLADGSLSEFLIWNGRFVILGGLGITGLECFLYFKSFWFSNLKTNKNIKI